MFKISIKNSKTRRLLVLEGKLVAPWTNELSSICHSGGSDLERRELAVDVRGVTNISPDGEEALLCLMVQGAKFRGAGVFMKEVLKQLTRRVSRNEQA
jgi:hypothetical protein